MSNYSDGPKYLDPSIVKPQRFTIKNGAFVQNDGETETHCIGFDRIQCKKCGKFTFHDIFLEISGEIMIKMQPIVTCRDCGNEEIGQITDAGNVQREIGNITQGHRTKSETGTRPTSESRKKKG
jgi:hypothetical protein